MTIPQKLLSMQKISGLSQTNLAHALGVSFVTLNRWMNGKATPRKGASQRIDALYREYSGLKEIPEDVLEAKKNILMRKAQSGINVLETILTHPDIRDQFVLTLTFTSNSIEGSTLTEAETAAVLFENTALPGKTFIEQLEAKNHQAALLFLFDYLKRKDPLDETLLLKLHSMLMNGIRQDAGSYRTHAVRIVGANVPTANYLKVPILTKELLRGIQHQTEDGIAHAANTHARFEQIHPFSDGNGRIGRLLLHAMLLKKNLPPAVIQPEKKRFYYSFLNAAQTRGDSSLLQDFLCDAITDGWKILEDDEA